MMRLLTLALVSSMLVTSASAQGSREVPDRGNAIFFSQGCYGCHRIGAAGTPIANDLSQVGRKYTEAQLADWLRDPAKVKASAHMPQLALTEEEIRALAAYLGSLR